VKEIVVDIQKCTGCRTCELRCAVERSSVSKNLREAVKEKPKPVSRVMVEALKEGSMPLQCRHCKDAPCLDACSTGALSRDEETGTVTYNDLKCIACWMCIMTCPFGIITPSRERGMILKCDRCFDMEYPSCVDACPTGALQYIDTEDIKVLSRERRKGVVKRSIESDEEAKKNILSLDFIV